MQHQLIPLALAAAFALLGSGLCLAADKTTSPLPATSQARAAPPKVPGLVDINSASREQLKTLPGIGDAEAARIIAARPYPSKAKLLADKVVSDEVYTGLKGRIVALQRAPPKPKTKTKPDGTAAGKS